MVHEVVIHCIVIRVYWFVEIEKRSRTDTISFVSERRGNRFEFRMCQVEILIFKIVIFEIVFVVLFRFDGPRL